MSKKQRTRDNNPTARQHFNKIVRRNKKAKTALQPVWGVTWNLRGRLMVPLGSASMMAMSSHDAPQTRNGETIELLCITPQVDPQKGEIHYSDVRMSHDFAKNPHEGARGRILDPRDEGTPCKEGDKPNGSWVRLAMELDRHRVRSTEQNYMLPTAPALPKFWAGFSSMDAIDMEVTPALKRDIADHMQRSFDEVDAMPASEVMMLGRTHWPELWIAPGVEGNDTGLWLIPAQYTTKLARATRIFEDFSEMVGVDCWNPARDIKGVEINNPTRDCACSNSLDLDATLKVIAAGSEPADVEVAEMIDETHDCTIDGDAVPEMTPTVFASNYDAAVDAMLTLRNCIKAHLGEYADRFDDDDLNAIIMHPDEPIVMAIEDLEAELDAETAIKLMRQQLELTRPVFSEGTTDDDLRAALANPAAPLHASRMCKFQVLRRDVRIAPEDAFQFTPEMLERDRVHANLWRDPNWVADKKTGGRRKKGRKPQRKAHATTK